MKSFIDLYFMHFQLKSGRIVLEAYISREFGTEFVLASLCQISAAERDRLENTDESKTHHFSNIRC